MCAQVVELQNKLSEESKKADKMEFEYKRVKEKVESLQKEKEVCSCVSHTHTHTHTRAVADPLESALTACFLPSHHR